MYEVAEVAWLERGAEAAQGGPGNAGTGSLIESLPVPEVITRDNYVALARQLGRQEIPLGECICAAASRVVVIPCAVACAILLLRALR
jgi:hypothetical protein